MGYVVFVALIYINLSFYSYNTKLIVYHKYYSCKVYIIVM